MAKLTKCDRCGTLMPGDNSYTVELTSPYPWELNNVYKRDLCVQCATDFRNFMDNEDVARRYRVKED